MSINKEEVVVSAREKRKERVTLRRIERRIFDPFGQPSMRFYIRLNLTSRRIAKTYDLGRRLCDFYTSSL